MAQQVWLPPNLDPNGQGAWVTPVAPNTPGAMFVSGIGYIMPPGSAPAAPAPAAAAPSTTPTANPSASPTAPTPLNKNGSIPGGTNLGIFNLGSGVGNHAVFETAGGTPYYFNKSTGQDMALSPQLVQSLNLPQIVGYDPGGHPIYYRAPAAPATPPPTPETNALQQTYQTDPGLQPIVNATEAFNANAIANANKVQQATAPANQTAATNTAGFFNNLSSNPYGSPQNAQTNANVSNFYNQLSTNPWGSPQNQATQQNLSQYYNNLAQSTLNGTLDPATLNQVQQASRAAQVARGNALGTSQAAQEALTTGLTGWEMGQQNAGNIANYLSNTNNQLQGTYGNIKSYLANDANQLQGTYGNIQNYLANNQNLTSNAANNTASYINSGTTPAAMGARSLSDIINQAQSANSNAPFQSTYNPAQTFTYLNPNAGNQFSTGANNWYNSANYQYLGSGAAGGGANPLGGALSGAASGAGTGALIGSIIPGIGTLVGGAIGAGVGGLGGYGASGGFCWVAQEVYGKNDPRWRIFRHWMLNHSPERLLKAYSINGPDYAQYISDKPELKEKIRPFMDRVINSMRRQYAR